MAEYDVIQKAKHYNSHPCGIEVINVVRRLDFNLGNVFKYVTRREGKECVRSLKSARYYLEDHWKHVELAPRLEKYPNDKGPLTGMVLTYAMHEPNQWAQLFYLSFLKLVKAPDSLEAHRDCMHAINALIREEEPDWTGGTDFGTL